MLSDDDFDHICEGSSLQVYQFLAQRFSQIHEETDSKLSVVTESQLTALMSARSAQDSIALNFLSTGCFANFIPAVVSARKNQIKTVDGIENAKPAVLDILQELSAMPHCDVLNDDLVTLLAKVIMSSKSSSSMHENSASLKVLIPATVSPVVRNALRSQLKYQGIDLIVLDYDKTSGCLSIAQLEPFDADSVLAIVLAWPNFFGQLEDINSLSNWAKNKKSLIIGLSDPLSLSLLQSPFSLTGGKLDYLMGDLQALGLNVNRSGIASTFLASANPLVEELNAYVSTQKINIDLPVNRDYLSVTGISGLYRSIKQSNNMLGLLVEKLTAIDGVTKRFSSTSVNECVIEIAQIDIEKALKILSGHNIVAGYLLQNEYPELANCISIYCSDQHSKKDIDKLASKVATVVKNLSTAGCPVKPKF